MTDKQNKQPAERVSVTLPSGTKVKVGAKQAAMYGRRAKAETPAQAESSTIVAENPPPPGTSK